MKFGQPFNPYGLFNGLFIPNEIAQSDLSDSAKLLLGRLYQYSGKNGKAYPSRIELADELNWLIRKLDRIIRVLKDRNLIETTQVHESSPSDYVFLYHEIYEKTIKNSRNKNTVKNVSGGTVKNDSRGTVKNNSTKSKKKELQKEKDLTKVKSQPAAATSKNNGFVNVDLGNRILKKIKKKQEVIVIKSRYTWTTVDLRNYNECTLNGATKHRIDTKAYVCSIDKLHALFSQNCKMPYHAVHTPEQYIDFVWDMDELLDTFKFQLKHSDKPIKSIGSFIFANGFGDNKSWSPLLTWHQKMKKTSANELTEGGTKLFSALKRAKIEGVEDLASSVLNRMGDEIVLLNSKYQFVNSSLSSQYPFGVVDYFSKTYLKKQFNNLKFKLVYIAKKNYVQDFLKNALSMNALTLKGRKYADVGQARRTS